MKLLLKIIISAIAVIISAYILPGVHVEGFFAAVVVAVVLALLNAFLKPLLVFFTIPVTVFTLGLFLLVINAAIIMLTSNIVKGFTVDGFWWALLFSVILSVITSLLEALIMKKETGNEADNNQ